MPAARFRRARSWSWAGVSAAGLGVLPEKETPEKHLGDGFARLPRDSCRMGDWQEAVRPDHYADDHLLFPRCPRHGLDRWRALCAGEVWHERLAAARIGAG
jgi:hypothetical protein